MPPTGTSEPAARVTSMSVPEATASISTFVLSVSTSAIGSPRSTLSPTSFNQETIYPVSMT